MGRDSGDEWQAYKGPVPLASVDDLVSRYYNFALGKCGWRGTVRTEIGGVEDGEVRLITGVGKCEAECAAYLLSVIVRGRFRS